MSSEHEEVAFEFFHRVATQSGVCNLDFHKVTFDGVPIAYRVVVYAFNRTDVVVNVEKKDGAYLLKSDDATLDNEVKDIISALLKDRL